MTNDVKNAMEAVQSLPPMVRKVIANNIIKNVEKLLELGRLVKAGDDSLKKHGGIPMEKVFSDMKIKHGL